MSRLEILKKSFKIYKDKITHDSIKYDVIKKDIKKTDSKLKALKNKEKINKEAMNIFLNIMNEDRDKVIKLIEKTISWCLTFVFDSNYRFFLEVIDKNNKTEVNFLVKNNVCMCDVNERGGGLIDIVSFCLKICVAEILGVDSTMIFDEPFKHLSGNYLENILQMVRSMSEKFNKQFIIVSHKETFFVQADNIIRL